VTDTPPDWVLIEAAKRTNWIFPVDCIRDRYSTLSDAFRALCDMIQKYEQPPVDRKALCAMEALKYADPGVIGWSERAAIRAIELWEEGFGRD